MIAKNKWTWLAAILLISASAEMLRAQDAFSDAFGGSDLQFFSPVDFDFEDRPMRKSNGYFFRYEKLNWAATGERNTIGVPNRVELSEIVVPDALSQSFGVTAGPTTAADLQYPIINGLQNTAPSAQFGWGDRYEFGFFDGDSGWQISILDGPINSSSNTFGNGPDISGFGSIHVNFDTPANFLLGFRDYWGSGEEVDFFVLPTETLNGPGGAGDGIVDDLDGDGAEGAVFILGPDPDDPTGDDIVVGIAVDADDLHRFNVRYNQLTIRNVTQTDGVELMRTLRLDNRHKEIKRQRSQWEIGYGFRFLRLRDTFSFNGTSDLLVGTDFVTEADNQLIGPQVRAKWNTQRGRWNLGLDGRFLFGYNVMNLGQAGSFGVATNAPTEGATPGDPPVPVPLASTDPSIIPGAVNRLISAQPTTFSYGRQDNDFSPTIELRANFSYQITRALAVKLGYTGIFVDNISRASQVTRYYLPDMGLRDGGKQNIYINGVNFGFDVVY